MDTDLFKKFCDKKSRKKVPEKESKCLLKKKKQSTNYPGSLLRLKIS